MKSSSRAKAKLGRFTLVFKHACKPILVHGHGHQKAFDAMGPIDVSMKMAELSLLSALRQAPDAIVVADGTSCRHQIADGTGRQALHVARLLESLL